MLNYNTQLPQLPLPEYGRNVQQMVDYCVTIENRDDRTRCARAIVAIMKNLFPEVASEEGGEQKFWDHLRIMSHFTLDVDSPYPPISEEEMFPKPQRVPYTASRIMRRHYGKHIERMANAVADMPNTDEKDMLVSMIAHHMKKLMLTHNKEGVDDGLILRDLAFYTQGRIDLDPVMYPLRDFEEPTPQQPAPGQGKKKKKHNNNNNFNR